MHIFVIGPQGGGKSLLVSELVDRFVERHTILDQYQVMLGDTSVQLTEVGGSEDYFAFVDVQLTLATMVVIVWDVATAPPRELLCRYVNAMKKDTPIICVAHRMHQHNHSDIQLAAYRHQFPVANDEWRTWSERHTAVHQMLKDLLPITTTRIYLEVSTHEAKDKLWHVCATQVESLM